MNDFLKIFSPSAWWRRGSGNASERLESTPGFLRIVAEERLSIVLTSRQSSMLASISASADACRFVRARMPASMGLAVRDASMAVGTGNGIRMYTNLQISAEEGSAYFPIGTSITGPVSIHDLDWDDEGRLWFVNTLFSSLCTVDSSSQFKVEWHPDFAGAIGPYDACHLSGMASAGGKPRYVTALAATSGREGWRARVPDSGVLIDIDGGPLCDGLSLPHSPKLHQDWIWLLEAGSGCITRIAANGTDRSIVAELPGVLRGLDFHGRYAFVGMSKVRTSSRDTAEALAARFGDAAACRIYAVEAETGRVAGHVDLPAIDEISSLLVVAAPRVTFLEPDHPLFSETFVCRLPGETALSRLAPKRTA